MLHFGGESVKNGPHFAAEGWPLWDIFLDNVPSKAPTKCKEWAFGKQLEQEVVIRPRPRWANVAPTQ